MAADSMVAFASGTGVPVARSAAASYDSFARLAATLCQTSGSVVMLLGDLHGWDIAAGTSRTGTPFVSPRLANLVLASQGPLIIEDTLYYPGFPSVPQVINLPPLRFFAGVSFKDPIGEVAGVLCVADHVPRVLTAEQVDSLSLLALQISSHLDLKETRTQLRYLQQENSAANLHANEELFRTFMDANPFLSYLKDEAGRLLFYNRSYADRFGIDEYAWLGRTDEQLWTRSTESATRSHNLEVLAGGRTIEAEERLHDADGSVTVWKTYNFPCHDSSGNLMIAGLAMDITEESERKQELECYQEEMQEANEQLRRLSMTDVLTGLRNRRAFEERLTLEFSMARRRNRELAMLLIDVDNFKQINDRRGHDAGDSVLRRLSGILRTTARLPDLVARYGGEEFVVLLPESGVDAALGFCRRFMERMSNEAWDHEPVTVSIGVATLDNTMPEGFQLVTNADHALYTAKREGKDRVVVYSSSGSSSPHLL